MLLLRPPTGRYECEFTASINPASVSHVYRFFIAACVFCLGQKAKRFALLLSLQLPQVDPFWVVAGEV